MPYAADVVNGEVYGTVTLLPTLRIVPDMALPTPESRRRGFWMRIARERVGISQDTAAKGLGLHAKSKSTLSKWENGFQEPRMSMLTKMAALYGVPVEFLAAPPPTAHELLDRRLQSATRAGTELEQMDWDLAAGPSPEGASERDAAPHRRSA